jgi:uncharacterized protein YjiS (DUF1127 family)
MSALVTETAETTRSRPTAHALINFVWLGRWWRGYRSARQTERALSYLDDHLLEDLGLSRPIIQHVGYTVRRIPSRYY